MVSDIPPDIFMVHYHIGNSTLSCYLKLVIFKLITKIDILSIACKIALRWMPQDLTDD